MRSSYAQVLHNSSTSYNLYSIVQHCCAFRCPYYDYEKQRKLMRFCLPLSRFSGINSIVATPLYREQSRCNDSDMTKVQAKKISRVFTYLISTKVSNFTHGIILIARTNHQLSKFNLNDTCSIISLTLHSTLQLSFLGYTQTFI